MSYLVVLTLNCHSGDPEGSVTLVVDGVLKVWYFYLPLVCWVMGVIGSGRTGSSTVSSGVRPVLGKKGGFLCPEGVLIAGRPSDIHRAGSEVQPWSEGKTIF